MSKIVVNKEQKDRNVRKLRTPPLDPIYLQQFLSPQAAKSIYEASPTIRRPLQVLHSPQNFSTPKKSNEMGCVETSSVISYSYRALPRFATPPSQRGEFVVTNPFDADLKNKLHLPIFSPSVFNNCVSPSKECRESFCWTIDDLSNIYPAPIDEQIADSAAAAAVFSPETELRTQQAIDSYFCAGNPALASPWPAAAARGKPARAEPATEGREASPSPPPPPEDTCHAWTQTELSLPPTLPPELEEALRPFFTFTQDQQAEEADGAMETSALRRKLFAPRPPSPVPSASPSARNERSWPRWPNLLLGNTGDSPAPCGRCHGSPAPGQRSQRSPSLSPVRAAASSQRKASASARLDFSDESMQVDRSFSVRCSFEGEDVAMASFPGTPSRNSLR